MTSIRSYAARIRCEALSRLRFALGIKSPSRAFADLRWDKLTIDGTPWPPIAPLPWYAARAPCDTYASPKLRRAARRVRRLIRRHWFALLFEPTNPEAMAVRAAMREPPRFERRSSLLEAVQQLEALGIAPRFEPGTLQDLAARCGVRWEGDT